MWWVQRPRVLGGSRDIALSQRVERAPVAMTVDCSCDWEAWCRSGEMRSGQDDFCVDLSELLDLQGRWKHHDVHPRLEEAVRL